MFKDDYLARNHKKLNSVAAVNNAPIKGNVNVKQIFATISKDDIVRDVVIESYERLITEKDARIKELKETIEILKIVILELKSKSEENLPCNLEKQ